MKVTRSDPLIPLRPHIWGVQSGIKSQCYREPVSQFQMNRVTHTEISSPFEDLSDIGSLGVVGPEPRDCPGCLETIYFVLEPVYPEYMPQEDEVFPTEEQPLPAAASPTTQSPDYVPESNLEANPEEDDDEDAEEDPVDYPADGGDDGDDEMSQSEVDDVVDVRMMTRRRWSTPAS
ncbi:hypothetical protein Tco_1316573 [Tanacetum coccineum]